MKILAHILPPLAVVVSCLAARVTSLPGQESPADSAVPAQGSGAPIAEEAVKTKCLEDGQLAVTFDDGPSPPNTPNLLELLEENDVKATFFVNANNVGNIMDPSSPDADIVRKAYEAGHVIASHTYGHPDLTTLSDQAVREQLCWVDRAIMRIIGKAPKLFRAPYGALNDHLLQMLDSLGYTIVHWNIDTSDWKVENTIENMVKEYTDTLRAAKSGVALQHDIHARTVNDLMPAVFAAMKAFGDEGNELTYVTADVCVGSEPYRDDPWQDTDPHADWYCPPPTQ